jgi:flagellar protein FliS
MRASLNPYQNTQVTTASPEKILVMLYDGAINFTLLAKERMMQKDLAGKGTYIGKSMAIVAELMATLNHEVGGKVASDLEQLYLYLIDEFTKANLHNDLVSLENAHKILVTLRDTWMEATEIWYQERNEMRLEQRASSVR